MTTKCKCCDGAGVQIVSFVSYKLHGCETTYGNIKVRCPSCNGHGTIETITQQDAARAKVAATFHPHNN